MKPRNPGNQTKIFREMPAHSLTEKFLPAISVFGHGRMGVRFPKSADAGFGLFIVVVNTRRRRIKVPIDTRFVGSLQQVRVYQHVVATRFFPRTRR